MHDCNWGNQCPSLGRKTCPCFRKPGSLGHNICPDNMYNSEPCGCPNAGGFRGNLQCIKCAYAAGNCTRCATGKNWWSCKRCKNNDVSEKKKELHNCEWGSECNALGNKDNSQCSQRHFGSPPAFAGNTRPSSGEGTRA